MNITQRSSAPLQTSSLSPVDQGPVSPTSDGCNKEGHGLNSKSRNARAQARHREKKKMHIAQLEATVSSLTDTLNDLKQRGIDDPTSLRFMALEAENKQLRHENAQLRHENNQFRDQLADAVRSSQSRLPAHQNCYNEYGSPREDVKRRKRSAEESFLASASVSLIPDQCFLVSVPLRSWYFTTLYFLFIHLHSS